MPNKTSKTELVSTGNNTKCQPGSGINTVSKATAPPGGCSQRSAIITMMAAATATEAATTGPGNQVAQISPTNADTVLPATTDQG